MYIRIHRDFALCVAAPADATPNSGAEPLIFAASAIFLVDVPARGPIERGQIDRRFRSSML
jgi:hypothetical protein